MSSQKKIDANRRNGRRGRGPRSLNGKSRSRLNALKHGLSIQNMADDERYGDAFKIASAIVDEDGDNGLVMEQALIIAKTELDLQRAGRARLAAIEQAISDADATRANSARQDSRTETAGTTADAFARALPALKQIERYERRAYSRRKRAVARLNDLRLFSQLSR